MGRSERQAYFERLVELRDAYGAAAEDHGAALSIDDAIRYAEAVMTAVALDTEPWLVERDRAFAGPGHDELGHPLPGPRFASDLWPRTSGPSLPFGRPDGIDTD
jgi:hypothetical protein